MKITKQDLTTLALLDQFNCSIHIGTEFVSMQDFNGHVHSVPHGVFGNITDLCVETINGEIPAEGTPNEDLTDTQKGLIQLLFEIEKAAA